MSTTSNTSTRPNRFAGRCVSCLQTVAAGEGTLGGRPGAWTVAHVGACPTPAPVVDETPYNDDTPVESPLAALAPGWRYAVETNEGPEGQPVRFFRVSKVRRNGSVYVDQQFGDNYHDAAIRFADGTVRFRDDRVRPYLATVASDPQAAAERYGKLKGVCYVGGETLTDWVSRALWVGPVCDHRSAKERKALALAAGATPDDEG